MGSVAQAVELEAGRHQWDGNAPQATACRVVLLAGGIASGKSTVARLLEQFGASRIDLDQLSREVLAPGVPTLRQVTEAFGSDLVDPVTGVLNRRLLAQRAFATRDATRHLEEIELPAIQGRLRDAVAAVRASGASCCVVEVPLLDRLANARSLADEVLVVVCPYELRRDRAVGRGMTVEDFEARAAGQPSDEWLCAHADTICVNDGDEAQLEAFCRAWWDERFVSGVK